MRISTIDQVYGVYDKADAELVALKLRLATAKDKAKRAA